MREPRGAIVPLWGRTGDGFEGLRAGFMSGGGWRTAGCRLDSGSEPPGARLRAVPARSRGVKLNHTECGLQSHMVSDDDVAGAGRVMDLVAELEVRAMEARPGGRRRGVVEDVRAVVIPGRCRRVIGSGGRSRRVSRACCRSLVTGRGRPTGRRIGFHPCGL
jgi:hypothetical protein